MTGTTLRMSVLAAAGLVFAVVPALADPRDDRIDALEKKLDDALAEIKALRAEQAAEKAGKDTPSNQAIDLKRAQAAQAADRQTSRTAPEFSLANGRPTFSTADGSSTLSIRSLVQFDAAYFSQDDRGPTGSDLSSGTNFRRARLGVDGKLFGDWSYSFLYDMGGSGGEGSKLSDAYIQYDGFGPVHLRTGSFATPGGLEDQTPTADLIFLERAGPADLARSVAGSDGRKNFLGIFTGGRDYYGALTWSASRAGDAAVFDAQQAAVGRLAYRVYKDSDTNVVLSATGTYVFKVADTAAGAAGPSAITFQEGVENTVDATRFITTGGINARTASVWGVETGANWKSLYAQAGYFGYGIARRASALPDPNFSGWYVQGTWVLTGERRGYNAASASFAAPRPTHPLDLKNTGFGAWELTARYSVTDLNYREGVAGFAVPAGGIRGGLQEDYTLGLNWYPNSVVRFLVDYQHLDIDRLGAAAPFFQIGQKIDILAARTQLAF